ncbi:MAG: S9 family peptidase [Deltaproteobacteria bacterium]|nr:S9 family peptidase [Deltaproteobacteria bacterium]
MKMILRMGSTVALLLLLFMLIPVQNISAWTQSLPARAFSALPEVYELKLSPDGKKIIFMQNMEDQTVLVCLDLDSGKKNFIFTTGNENLRFGYAEWANNEMVLFSVLFPYYRYGIPTMETRLFVGKADGSEESYLLIKPESSRPKMSSGPDHYSQFQDNIISLLPDDPEHILMGIDLEEPTLDTVYKINIYTKDRSVVQHFKKNVRDWRTDQQDRVRIGTMFNPSTTTISTLLYDPGKKEWKEIWQAKPFDNTPFIEPMGFGLDPDILYVRADHKGRNAIFRVDVSRDDLPMELLASDDTYDISGSLIHSRKTRDVIGVYHGEAKDSRIYWNEEYKRFQMAVNKALPDTTNYLIDFSEDEKRYIVYSTSDTVPGKYYLGDRNRKFLGVIANSYPQLDGKLQGSEKVTYTARDGQKIEAYITLPAGYKKGSPCPAVIFPHGGPMARDYGGFDYWAEFFASKGIAVLQPNFRGSSGYGREFEEEAVQRFGLTMQDDLTDAARWLIQEKIADPERIAIAGASYGGYAALMGAVKTPDLFRCAISFAGIGDLNGLLKSSQGYLNYGVARKQLGTDKKQLKAVSPLYHIDKIKIPILLGHGDDDRTVPVDQSRDMAKELKKENKVFTYVELEKGDHNLSLQDNRHRFFEAMDSFLNKYLLN